ncbi:ribonuclease H-like domain-containing protein [Paenibacillus sinopodophylli]|uniref:ribonuclease H-like domain-containing protein n=1 Tax=Paenibacillus sinopodophylli TaxID=1837342 RepID=UPI00110CDF5B|nr:ribonuclease H-like domain-containing protein [Paenibacillus sinopodophylli]
MSGMRDRMNKLRGITTSLEAVPEDTIVLSSVQHEDDDIFEEDQQLLEWSAIGVELATNEIGSFLLRVVHYPFHHRHGLHALKELQEAAPGLTAFHPEAEQASAEQILFLDLETTGLGVGAGNVPFMVGIAYMSKGHFVIEQALIRHPAEERAMLSYLAEKLQQFTYLSTYNGKTFDWPLVENRFIMNGFGRQTWSPKHLDFLHPARSIWRNTLVSCKLSHVEEERLGINREDDVPGSLAPQLYFQYLADGNPTPLEGVFRHNEMDMLSLACLAIRFGHLLNGDIEAYIPLPDEVEEMVRTGLWLERMGNTLLPARLFETAMNQDQAKPTSLLMLAARDKKAGNWGRAVLLWQKAIIHSASYFGPAAQEASIELAMYYEHKLKNYEAALSHAVTAFEHALNHSTLVRTDSKKRAELEALRNRISRLRRKASKHR